MNLKDESGLSKLQNIVASMLIGLSILTMLILGKIFNRTLNATSNKFDAVFMINGIKELLSSKKICSENLSGLEVGVDNSLTGLTNQYGKKKYLTSKFYNNNTLRIRKMNFGLGEKVELAGRNYVSLQFVVTMEKLENKKVLKGSEYTIPLNLKLRDIGGGKKEVVSCITSSSEENSLWKSTSKGITFNEGKVGIGVGKQTVKGKLQIHDNDGVSVYVTGKGEKTSKAELWFSSSLGQESQYVGIGQRLDGSLRMSARGNLLTPDFFINNLGKVGVGVKKVDDFSQVTMKGPIMLQTNTLSIKEGNLENPKSWAHKIEGDVYSLVEMTEGKMKKIMSFNTKSSTASIHLKRLSLKGKILKASDENLKEDIFEIESPLKIIEKMRGVFYKYKDSNEQHIGVLAQEMEKVLPEIVYTQEGSKSVAYEEIIPVLIEGIKDLKKQNELLLNLVCQSKTANNSGLCNKRDIR
jgi:hypothetical protein